jgi:hypothetical protein
MANMQLDKVITWYSGRAQGWKKQWGELWDGTKIYIVNGPYVRENFFVDFVEGGHGYVYKWIPKDEIWVEDMPDEIDQGLNMNHEIYEYTLMRYVPSKKDYDDAHKCAACVESLVRQAIAGNPTLKKRS